MPFEKLRLIEPLRRAVASEGYTLPTDIQVLAIPHVLEGKDLMGCAQTGTGKTAAFALPIIQRLLHNAAAAAKEPHAAAAPAHAAPHHAKPADSHHRGAAPKGGPSRVIRALILAPTRELAAQIGESFGNYGKHTHLRHAVIFGGVGQGPQTQALHRGVDILVATPGRLLDLLNQRHLTLRHIEILVLDEADRMLDMGFIHDIRRVMQQMPDRRQTLMFSATMPREIRTLAQTILHDPVEVKVASTTVAVDIIEQSLYFIDPGGKIALLEQLLKDPAMTRALVFTRTKRGADKVAKRLSQVDISTEAIHSNKSQNARIRALANFKKGATRVLVASDIAARGLDVDDISHVVNFDLPNEPETYVHRIGRTGRAGAAGKAISFCSDDQYDELRDIEKLLGRAIPVLKHTIKMSTPVSGPGEFRPVGRSRGGSSGQGRRGGSTQKPASGHRSAGSPEQQKAQFWHSRRKPGGRGFRAH